MEQLSLFEDMYDVAKPEDEMIEKGLSRGSGYTNGKKRIYEFVLTNPSTGELTKFLRDEYGTGGYGLCITEPYRVRGEFHDSSGIKFSWYDDQGIEIEQSITWNKAAEVIIGMFKRGIYQKEETN